MVRGRPRVNVSRGGGAAGAWGRASAACSQASHSGLWMRPANDFGSLERFGGGRMGSTSLRGVAGHWLGQATCSIKNIQRNPKTTIREKNCCGIMAYPLHNGVIRGHFTRFSGQGNYPQAGGTRPDAAVQAYVRQLEQAYDAPGDE